MADFFTEAFLRLRNRRRQGEAWAEDALQEAFVRLWGRYSPASETEAEALLSRAARNASTDEFRRKKPSPLGDADIADEYEGPSHEEKEASFKRVESIVNNRLNEIQQYIIRRHQYAGASLEAVARELGMKPPAVRMQLSRARKTIRTIYNDERQDLL